MRHLAIIIGVLFVSGLLSACKNREVNENEGPNFSEIHEDIEYHFDKVNIDGVDYHILERDRNNPHEGFGFMALNGIRLIKNQDSIKAYLKTIMDAQAEILSKINNQSLDETDENLRLRLEDYLSRYTYPEVEKETGQVQSTRGEN